MKLSKLLSLLVALTVILSVFGTISIRSSAETYLDLESSATYSNSKTLDQNYNLVVKNGTYTNVTKVELTWSINDIEATREDARVWNPSTLSWDEDDNNDQFQISDGSASFTITNLSSVKIDAKVEFEPVSGFNPATSYSGVDATTHTTTIGTVVKANKSVDTEITHDANIDVTVTPVNADFASKDAASATNYGSYTITLNSIAREFRVYASSSNDPGNYTITINGETPRANSTDTYIVYAGDVIVLTAGETRSMFGFYKYDGAFVASLVTPTKTMTGGSISGNVVNFTVPSGNSNYCFDFGPMWN